MVNDHLCINFPLCRLHILSTRIALAVNMFAPLYEAKLERITYEYLLAPIAVNIPGVR
jgi:hypothetical protein